MPDKSAIDSTRRIAVAGATGRVGGALVRLLATDPVEVVALTRRPTLDGLPARVAAATIDFERPSTLADALRGADVLFLAQGTSQQQVVNEIALIDAAVETGVRHIVKLSSMGPASRLQPFGWHMRIEAHLALQPVASTVLRPSMFADVLKRGAAQIVAGTWGGAAAGGRVSYIDTRDVADVARVAVLEEVTPDTQRAFHLTGSRVWTMHEVAAELSRLLGHAVEYGDRSLAEQRALLLASGIPSFVAELLVGLDQVVRDSVLGEITSTVEVLSGHRPRPLTDWLAENLATFGG